MRRFYNFARETIVTLKHRLRVTGLDRREKEIA